MRLLTAAVLTLFAGSAFSQTAGGVSINTPDNTLIPGLTINQNAAGSTGFTEYCLGMCLNINSDIITSQLGVNGFQVNYNFGGDTVTGTRTGLMAILTQTAKANAADPYPAYVGITGAVIVNSDTANPIDAYFGGNTQARSNARGALQLAGSESDVFGTENATQAYQFGYSAVGLFVNPGSTLDAAYELHMGAAAPYGAVAPGPGWQFGLVAAELGNGYVPISPTGTFIGTKLQTLASIPVAYGIDIRGLAASANQIIGTGFNIDPTGVIHAKGFVVTGPVGANCTVTRLTKLVVVNGVVTSCG